MSLEREEALDAYLSHLRKQAGLSLEKVCDLTKIQSRYVKALEDGHYGELPSNTHLRAFSLAITAACNGDADKAALLVRRVLNQEVQAPVVVTEAVPVKLPQPSAPLKAMPPVAAPAMVAAVALPQVDPIQAADGLVQGASQKMKALPWQALLVLAGGAALLSALLLWGVKRWQGEAVIAVVAPTAETAPLPAGTNLVAPAVAEASAPVLPATQLTLRARRPCWLVLEIDGQRLPTITLEDGDKRSWDVSKKAVLLAGNLGALRVWWNKDNMGYLGELGQRSNGLVFEPGKAPKTDKSSNLPLPAGVPE